MDIQQGEHRCQQTEHSLVGTGSDEITVKRITGWHVRPTWLAATRIIPENDCIIFTAKLTHFINLRLPSRYSLKAFSHSWSSWRITSGEFGCSRATAKGVLERSVPVILVYYWLVGQGSIDDELDVRSGRRCLSSRRHGESGWVHVPFSE